MFIEEKQNDFDEARLTVGFRAILISRTLTRLALCGGGLFSSSQKFEKNFFDEFSKIVKSSVASLGGGAEPRLFSTPDAPKFFCTNYAMIFLSVVFMRDPKKVIFITTGYNPIVVSLCLFLILRGGRAFSFIYDSHKSSMKKKNIVKRSIVGVYFGIGFMAARFLSGWIVLNDSFIREEGLDVNYIKIKVGSEGLFVRSDVEMRSEIPVFLFSGTLNEENGIPILLQSFAGLSNMSAQLHIYGSGPLVEEVERAAGSDPRVLYFGRSDNQTVRSRQADADFLVHLRDPNCVSASYSYPSKLIEYLESGTPVISNEFPGMGDALNHVVKIEGFDAIHLGQKIAELAGKHTPPEIDQAELRQFLDERRWALVASQVRDFVTVQSP